MPKYDYYYYDPEKNAFISSTSPKVAKFPLSELEYLVSRMIVKGYERQQIQEAVERVFRLINEGERND